MLCSPFIAALVIAITLGALSTRAAAQIPPETSIYELIDIVPSPAPATCSCVSGPFALPTFRPGPGWGSGPAAPIAPAQPAPVSEISRARDAERLAQERERIPRTADDGLAGNGNASISVAIHLRESSLAAGIDERTEEEAARWLHLAAGQEHPDAFMFLGYRHQRGDGVPQSDEGAAYWFHQGAVRGDKTSMVALGLRHAAGRGGPQDFAAAVYWWRQAGATPLASRFLGDAYACGLGVDRDPERAVREYKKSADAGEISSTLQLGRIYIGGCVAPNDGAAVKAFRRAADDGHPDAQIALSELILQGRGVEASAPEAYYWARIAERRLAAGEQRTLAGERVKAAARMMSRDEIAAAEILVETMIAETAKRMQ